MTLEQILLIALGAVLQTAILAIAYRIGKHNGYWSRVDQEKSARGIW